MLQTILILILLVVSVWGRLAQAVVLPDSDWLSQERSRLQSVESPSAEQKELRDAYADILDLIAETRRLQEREAQTRSFTQKVRQQIRQLDTESARLRSLPPKAVPDDDLETLENLLFQAETQLQSKRAEAERLRSDVQQQNEQPERLKQQILETEQALSEITAGSASSSLMTDQTVAESGLEEARTWLELARREVYEARLSQLREAFLAHPRRQAVLRGELELNELELARQEQYVEALRSKVLFDKLVRTKQLLQKAEQSAASIDQTSSSVLRAFAERSQTIGRQLVADNNLLVQVQSVRDSLTHALKRIEHRMARTRKKVEVAGLNRALGRVLLEERSLLPQSRQYRLPLDASRIADIGLRQIKFEEDLEQIRDRESYRRKLIARTGEDASAELRPQLDPLVTLRYELLEHGVGIESTLLELVTEVQLRRDQLNQEVEAYRRFLNQHLLWMRSAPAVNMEGVAQAPAQLFDIARVSWHASVWEEALDILTASPWIWGVFFIAVLVVYRKSYFKDILRQIREPLGKVQSDHLFFTLKALAITVLLSMPLAITLLVFAYPLQQASAGSPAEALGISLLVVAKLIFFVQLFRKLALPTGMLAVHFRWPEASVEAIYRASSVVLYTLAPLIFVATYVNSVNVAPDGSLQQLVLTGVLLTFCFVFARILKPRGASRFHYGRHHQLVPGSVVRLVRFILIGVPFILAVMALAGFTYSAGIVALRIADTVFLLLGILLVYELIVRWLSITRRKISYQQAMEKRAALLEKREAENAELNLAQNDKVDEPVIDVEEVSKGAHQSLTSVLMLACLVGLIWIWQDILPAFNIFDQFTVWEYTKEQGEVSRQIPVTLFDVLTAIVIFIIALLAARRIPALLEFAVLPRFDLSAGSHYAIKTLTSYGIVATGFLMTVSTLGASWSQIQWLAAALSVGIGFGLQEIVANFISGLIILFERPVRVGDIVTVGDTDGIVTRINIRATTIRNWDQKELLVPNKEFITNRLLNWTLSDSTLRIMISVGVAYGSDMDKTLAIIERIAPEQDGVLDDPEPIVSFEEFGDNALIVYLRVFINDMEKRFDVITGLHQTIYSELNKAGIVIAFPQRDVHLDSSKPLQLEWVNGPNAGEKTESRHDSFK